MSASKQLLGGPVAKQILREVQEMLNKSGSLGLPSIRGHDDKKKQGGETYTQAAPGLAILADITNPVVQVYINQKVKVGEQLGVSVQVFDISNASVEGVKELIHQLNENSQVNGIIVQLPLPDVLASSATEIFSVISLDKDVDSLNPFNYGRVFQRSPKIIPPTPQAAIEILKFYDIQLNRKKVLIVGDGILVGRPLYALIKQNFNPEMITVIDKACENPHQVFKEHEVVFLATGAAHYFTADYFREEHIVIDMGTSVIKAASGYKLVGDLNPNAYDKVTAYTPTPGGVGPVTVALLFKNLTQLYLEWRS